MHRPFRSSFPGHRPLRTAVSALAAVASLTCLARPAHAQISSWAAVASGPTWIDEGQGATETGFHSVPTLQMQTGIGSSPASSFIVGGLFQLQTHFGRGTDMGLLARFATQGFVLGDWGGAIDLGGYARFWGLNSQGGLGALVLGAPWGIQLSAGGGIGTHESREFGVVLGIDFARLTVYRTTGESWFPNPYPAYRRP